MRKYIVVVEDKEGNEWKGSVETNTEMVVDQLVTIKNYKGTYTRGFVVEILGEKNGNITRIN